MGKIAYLRAPRCRRFNLKKYGLTPADWDDLLAAQNGCCPICGIAEQKEVVVRKNGVYQRSSFVVDHNHQTSEVRALLCNTCNRMLGLAKENSTVLRCAAEYLGSFGDQ